MKKPLDGGELARQHIPVLRPQLPAASQLLPYLQRIDQTRIYSNWGPLTLEFSERLATRFSVPANSVICANSGMSALGGAILAAAGYAAEGRDLAIVPNFTFTATALAAKMAGYKLAIASCAADTWTFSSSDLLGRPSLLHHVGLVVPVAPFGRPIQQQEWQQFRERTGIPVVIDGAACFEAFATEPRAGLGPLPVALSFHATKSFGVGEGGAVVTTDRKLATATFRCLNFGFFESRNTAVTSINGKMPEYTAAVGLAELDGWDKKQRRSRAVFAMYQEECERLRLGARLRGAPEISSSYVLLECESAAQASRVVATLAEAGIETRFWYGTGLAGHDAFRQSLEVDLHGQQTLDPRRLVGLPTAIDFTPADVHAVVAAMARSLAR